MKNRLVAKVHLKNYLICLNSDSKPQECKQDFLNKFHRSDRNLQKIVSIKNFKKTSAKVSIDWTFMGVKYRLDHHQTLWTDQK